MRIRRTIKVLVSMVVMAGIMAILAPAALAQAAPPAGNGGEAQQIANGGKVALGDGGKVALGETAKAKDKTTTEAKKITVRKRVTPIVPPKYSPGELPL